MQLSSKAIMNIVLASGNEGKQREFNQFLSPIGLTILSQKDLNIPSIEETAPSFVENAILKARHASSLAKLPALADDSGLIVQALQGAPGIYSARYAGSTANSEQNMQKILEQLANVPDDKRDAFFYCVLVFLNAPDDPSPIICEGRWYGRILRHKRGNQGFGYDPIFWVPDQQCSAAELNIEQKNKISHRAQALTQLQAQLRDHYASISG